MAVSFNPLTGNFDLTSGMAIGAPVASATAASILFVDGSGNLTQDNADLFYGAGGTSTTHFQVGPYSFLKGGIDVGDTAFFDTTVAMSIKSGRTWLFNMYGNTTNPLMFLGQNGHLSLKTITSGTNATLTVNDPNTVDNLAAAHISIDATGHKGLIIQGLGAGNLQEWQSSIGTILSSISSTGVLTAPGLTSTAGLTITGGNTAIGQDLGHDFSVGGNSLTKMISVRGGFDRVGFGFANTGSTIDNPFDVNLDAQFRTVLAVGNNSSPDNGKIINVDQLITTDTGDQYGGSFVNRVNLGADSGSTYFGGFFEAQTLSGGAGHNLTSGLRGAKFFAQHNMAGTVANAYGGEFQVQNTSTGTVTAGAALHIVGATNSGGGTLTTNNALLIDNQTAGATNFAIKTGTGQNSLGDKLQIKGNLTLNTAGNKILITTGTNASVGTGTLSGGTVTISTTAVTASSLIFLTDTSNGANLGVLSVGTITATTSFVVNSSNALDTGTFNWWLIN